MADLVSEMVGEFPELQGVMGRYYALEAGIQSGVIPDPRTRSGGSGTQTADSATGSRIDADASSGMTQNWTTGLSEADVRVVADAIRDHYKPQGPSDSVPTDPVGIAVALADKLDTLVGFWAIDEKPTGSKDPFALRRAALGVVRIVLENETRVALIPEINEALVPVMRATKIMPAFKSPVIRDNKELLEFLREHAAGNAAEMKKAFFKKITDEFATEAYDLLVSVPADLLSFFADRLKQHLRDQGQRHDLIDAVFALGEDDLVLITKRVEALGDFLGTEDGANLLAGYKRAANILRAEEKKGALPEELVVDGALIDAGAAQEVELHQTLGQVRHEIEEPLKSEDFEAVMTHLATLRGPVDAFFEHVMVNAENAQVRANRLALLNDIRETLHRVADFSLIEG